MEGTERLGFGVHGVPTRCPGAYLRHNDYMWRKKCLCECLELRGRERNIREGKQTKKMWKKVTERLGFWVHGVAERCPSAYFCHTG